MRKNLYKIFFDTNTGLGWELTEVFNKFIENLSKYDEKDETENTDVPTSTSKQVNVAGYSKQDINVSIKNQTLLLVNENPNKPELEIEIDIPKHTKSIDIEIENGMATINFIPNPTQSIELNIK